MFSNQDLVDYLKTSHNISINSVVIAEWNMNSTDMIDIVGNYRFRPNDMGSIYKNLPNTYDPADLGNFYTGAIISETFLNNTLDNDGTLQIFKSNEEKTLSHYSLEDCIKPFRPRSGINKLMYFNKKYIPNNNIFAGYRPRYYMSSKYDNFKYWTSYRKEDKVERGIANKTINGRNVIEDACPFVIYKQEIPTNRIVLKVQTNVGNVDAGTFVTLTGAISDPFYSATNQTTPNTFKIQVLKNNNWVDIFSKTEKQLRQDGTPIIDVDGYLELFYSDNQWFLGNSEVNYETPFVTNLSNPDIITNGNVSYYKEFDLISGIRIVVETMNKFDSTFDLIEISPRLAVDLSKKVSDFKITKVLSDMSSGPLPVGQLLASTGSISLFDDDFSFNENNSNSIISNYLNKNTKFSFYENVYNDESVNYFIPIKTMYVDNFKQQNSLGLINLDLRDLYFYFESQQAPRMLLVDVSLSYAISTLLDSAGYSNYSFKRLPGENDPIIPYFFIAPNQTIAEVLQQLAIASQYAMFFDEYNNFIVMSKNYMLPEKNQRQSDIGLVGTDNKINNPIIKNLSSSDLPNIIDIVSQDKQIFNDGRINYTNRYLQKNYGSIRQSLLTDRDQTWIYKPALLWEVSGDDATKTINSQVAKKGSYVLGAMPLASDLSDSLPTVVNHVLTNNVIDVGENIYWLTRYKGFLYSAGEIIKYDAAQFNVNLPVWYPVNKNGIYDYSKPLMLPSGTLPPEPTIDAKTGEVVSQYKLGSSNIWIEDNQQYQDYLGSLPFNGKIYATGILRISTTPYYETVDGILRLRNGDVAEHGRGQFGTKISSHFAGLPAYWSNNDYVRGCNMESKYLFTTEVDPVLPSTQVGAAGVNNVLARQSQRTGLIKNFMSSDYKTETGLNYSTSTQTPTVQSSAFVMTGPSFQTTDNPLDFITYTYKSLDNVYKHFGTRMRIIGTTENNENRLQTPIGSIPYYQIPGAQPNQSINIGGGSGGISILLNSETNNGYYFEIIALTENNIESYMNIKKDGTTDININNVIFYKVKNNPTTNKAVPIKLYGGLAKILVDDGRFTGQSRLIGEDNPTVYDLAVEYMDIGKIRRFFLYINNKLIATVDDNDPLPKYNNTALFVRGSTKSMFENIYALNENYSQNTVFTTGQPLSSVFGTTEINANDSFRKYAMSGVIQSTYLSGISTQQSPNYNIYFDEFGTIMRECAYFDIKYDKAYPAIYAKLSPTFNRIKGYTVSGFYADSYGAEFLVFNATDTALNLDETTGNYLRIQGITFTQDTTYQLTVDDYFNKKTNLSSPQNSSGNFIESPFIQKQIYNEIRQSRLNHGVKDFTIESLYIQKSDEAESLLGWIIDKSMRPRKMVGVSLFALPNLQLGDLVTIDYEKDGVNIIKDKETQFVVYQIEYERQGSGPSMTAYLAEV